MSDYNNTQGYALDWDSEIEQDSNQFVLLPEGDYPFTVTGFERGTYDGGKKIPACKKADLSLNFDGGALGTTTVRHTLFLHSVVEGLLSSFFMGIGQKKKGERVTMNWGAVIGGSGRAHLGIRTYTKKDGSEGKANEVKYFIDPEEAPTVSHAPSTPATPPTLPSGNYQAGKF